MMFKIIKYRNHSGKIQMTIETDDQMAADFCRFFGTINKFVDLFNYRVRSAKSSDLTDPLTPSIIPPMRMPGEYTLPVVTYKETKGCIRKIHRNPNFSNFLSETRVVVYTVALI